MPFIKALTSLAHTDEKPDLKHSSGREVTPLTKVSIKTSLSRPGLWAQQLEIGLNLSDFMAGGKCNTSLTQAGQ